MRKIGDNWNDSNRARKLFLETLRVESNLSIFFKKKLDTFDDFVTSKVLEMFRLHFLVIVSEKL